MEAAVAANPKGVTFVSTLKAALLKVCLENIVDEAIAIPQRALTIFTNFTKSIRSRRGALWSVYLFLYMATNGH